MQAYSSDLKTHRLAYEEGSDEAYDRDTMLADLCRINSELAERSDDEQAQGMASDLSMAIGFLQSN